MALCKRHSPYGVRTNATSRSAAAPVRPGGASGKNADAPGPAQVRLQVNVIMGEQVFPGVPFEISAEALAALRRPMGSGVLPARVSADLAAFSLRRCHEVWQVVCEGDQDFFGHTMGMNFINHHLKHPGEAIHPVALLAQLQGQEPVQQRWVRAGAVGYRVGGPRPLKGGRAVTTHKPAEGIEQTLVQGENPSQATKQDQETVKVRNYTVPAGSRMEQSSATAFHDSQYERNDLLSLCET